MLSAEERRARRLLRAQLTEEQWAEYRDHGTVTIKGREHRGGFPGYVYCIQAHPQHHTITVQRNGHYQCIHIDPARRAKMPLADQVLAFVLMLRAAEGAFTRTANCFQRWP